MEIVASSQRGGNVGSEAFIFFGNKTRSMSVTLCEDRKENSERDACGGEMKAFSDR